MADAGDHHAASSRTPKQNFKVLLLELAYDLTQIWHEPKKSTELHDFCIQAFGSRLFPPGIQLQTPVSSHFGVRHE